MTFLGAAFRDYIAARTLLNNALPLQGAIQASTAIEKYVKTLLAFKGNASHGHLKEAHFNTLRNLVPELYATFNEEFLRLCKHVYDLRYPDSLPPGYNLVIAAREFLAALDDTALAMHGSFYFWQDGKELKTDVELHLENEDPRLLFNNHVLLGIERQKFIAAKPQYIYEMRVNTQPGGLVEILYVAQPRESDARFLREGARPSGDDSYLLAFKMLREEEAEKWSGRWVFKEPEDARTSEPTSDTSQ